MTPAQSRAGRALIEWTIEELSEASGVSPDLIVDFETSRARIDRAAVEALAAALEEGGVRLIPEDGGGAGVRLKFTQSEVKRIATLESEGGIIAEDDV